jgi:tetratricopeptide (TPR) repeat protein
MKWAALLCSTLVALAGAPVALAQNAPDFEAAKQHYFAAKEAARHSDWAAAVKEYQAAYDITKDPTLWKQIGQAHEYNGERKEAIEAYHRYLAEAKNPSDSSEILAHVTELEAPAKAVGQAPASVPASAPASAPAPTPAPAPAPASVPAPAPEPHGAPPVLNGVDVPPAPPPDFLSEGGSWQRTAGWVSVGVGAVALVTASVFATSALSRKDDVQRLTDYIDPTTGQPKQFTGTVKDDYNSKIDEGKKLNTYAAIAFAGAGVAAGAAVLFFILDHNAERKDSAASIYVAPGGGGVIASWTF